MVEDTLLHLRSGSMSIVPVDLDQAPLLFDDAMKTFDCMFV